LPFEVRGEVVDVDGVEHGACVACGEVYLSLAATEQLQKDAIAQSKAAKGLLSSAEIKALRQSLALSQSAFEQLLGVGAKTVVRWEKGTVFQSATADRVMRLIRLMPWLASILRSGELYMETASCTPKVTSAYLSKDWEMSQPRTNHLRVVDNRDNSAAA
jgi:putative zinc finger/helix-turn-helix YgiT family protein